MQGAEPSSIVDRLRLALAIGREKRTRYPEYALALTPTQGQYGGHFTVGRR